MAQDDKYLPELMAEKDSIDPSFVHALRLIKQEIERINNQQPAGGQKQKKKDLLDITGRPQKIECDILVPVDRNPNINFVGRLIGPGGATMKSIQQMTSTKLAVLGRGSIRQKDRKEAEELKDKDEKYAHLNYPLHVHLCALGPVPQAFVNLGRAAAEVQKLVMVDESEGQGYGGGDGGWGMRGGRGGGMRGGRGFQRGGRGGTGSRGATTQGSRGTTRGGGRGQGAGRGQAQQYGAMSQSSASSYSEDFSYDASATGFETGYEGYDSSYNAEAGYGDGSYTEDYKGYGQNYGAFGNGGGAAATANSTGGYGGQTNFRGKMRGGGSARGRQNPY